MIIIERFERSLMFITASNAGGDMATQTLIEQFRQDIGNVTSTTDER
jgi:hypothetical protein